MNRSNVNTQYEADITGVNIQYHLHVKRYTVSDEQKQCKDTVRG